MSIKFVKSKNEGRIGISSPYNAKFVAEFKKAVPSAKWNGLEKIWFFDVESKPAVDALVEKFFGEENLNRYRIEWEFDRQEILSIDGVDLMIMSRDDWRWKSSDIKFTVVECDLKSAGSRRYPDITGRLVIEAEIRDGAEIIPEPDSFERIEAATKPDAGEIDNEIEIARLTAALKPHVDAKMTDAATQRYALELVALILEAPQTEAAMAKAETDSPAEAFIAALNAYIS